MEGARGQHATVRRQLEPAVEGKQQTCACKHTISFMGAVPATLASASPTSVPACRTSGSSPAWPACSSMYCTLPTPHQVLVNDVLQIHGGTVAEEQRRQLSGSSCAAAAPVPRHHHQRGLVLPVGSRYQGGADPEGNWLGKAAAHAQHALLSESSMGRHIDWPPIAGAPTATPLAPLLTRKSFARWPSGAPATGGA